MKLLLDTHVWLWTVLHPDRLSRRVAAAMRSSRNELWISPISAWEICLLVERGRLRGIRDAASWIEAAWASGPFQEAPLTRAVAVRARAISVPHEDPADRFLGATAAVYDLTLVTADDNLLEGKGFQTLANR